MMVENGCASWRIPSVAANTVHTNSMTPFSTKNHDIIVVILHIFLYYWMNKWRMCFWIFHFLKIHCKYFWNFSRLSKAITSFHSVTIHTHTHKKKQLQSTPNRMQLLTVSQRETGDTNELSSDQRRLLRTPAAPWGAIQFNLIFTIHFAPTKIKFLNLYSKSLLIYNPDDFFVNNSQISKLISILPQVCILIALKIIREPFVQLNVISSQKQFRNLFVFFVVRNTQTNRADILINLIEQF